MGADSWPFVSISVREEMESGRSVDDVFDSSASSDRRAGLAVDLSPFCFG